MLIGLGLDQSSRDTKRSHEKFLKFKNKKRIGGDRNE